MMGLYSQKREAVSRKLLQLFLQDTNFTIMLNFKPYNRITMFRPDAPSGGNGDEPDDNWYHNLANAFKRALCAHIAYKEGHIPTHDLERQNREDAPDALQTLAETIMDHFNSVCGKEELMHPALRPLAAQMKRLSNPTDPDMLAMRFRNIDLNTIG